MPRAAAADAGAVGRQRVCACKAPPLPLPALKTVRGAHLVCVSLVECKCIYSKKMRGHVDCTHAPNSAGSELFFCNVFRNCFYPHAFCLRRPAHPQLTWFFCDDCTYSRRKKITSVGGGLDGVNRKHADKNNYEKRLRIPTAVCRVIWMSPPPPEKTSPYDQLSHWHTQRGEVKGSTNYRGGSNPSIESSEFFELYVWTKILPHPCSYAHEISNFVQEKLKLCTNFTLHNVRFRSAMWL